MVKSLLLQVCHKGPVALELLSKCAVTMLLKRQIAHRVQKTRHNQATSLQFHRSSTHLVSFDPLNVDRRRRSVGRTCFMIVCDFDRRKRWGKATYTQQEQTPRCVCSRCSISEEKEESVAVMGQSFYRPGEEFAFDFAALHHKNNNKNK